MKELTEEQKKFLIEKMNQLPIDFVGAYADGFHMCRLEIKDLLDKYTEDSFPKFEIPVRNFHGHCVGTLGFSSIDGDVCIDAPVESFIMSCEEFTSFTQACQEAKRWLDEQEENNKC